MITFRATVLVGLLQAVGVTGATAQEAPLPPGDADVGVGLYARECVLCHHIERARNHIGPHLKGVWGKPAGWVESYRYSDALPLSGLVWDEEGLNVYLRDPLGSVQGTKMGYPGLEDPQERADVIAYLKRASEEDS